MVAAPILLCKEPTTLLVLTFLVSVLLGADEDYSASTRDDEGGDGGYGSLAS